MKKYLPLIVLLLLTSIVFAVDFPEPTGYVNDFANIFSEQEKQEMETMLAQIEKDSTVEISVVTITSLEGLSKEQYAVELFEKWGIGKKDVDNGLLILIAPNEREYRIEVGYGLEGVITDTMAGVVGRKNFVENFRAEKYGKGVHDAILDFKGLIEKDPAVVSEIEKSPKEPSASGWFSVIMIFVTSLIIFSVVMRAITKKQKKRRSIASRLIAGAVLFVLIWFVFNVVVAIIAFVLYVFFVMIPFKSGFFIGGPGYRGGFRGGFSGGRGGFGGFGGGGSGGGGAGGGW